MALETPANDQVSPLTFPLACATTWSEAAGESLRASIAAWMTFADACAEAQRTYVTMLGQALGANEDAPLALASAAADLLKTELAASERAAEHLAYVAEEALSEVAGRVPPLPD